MKILNIKNTQEKTEALNLCKNLIEKNALIPVVGAGFSFDTPTDNKGKIPSVRDLREKLYEYIDKYSDYEQRDLDEIKGQNLSEIADVFWRIYNRIPAEPLSSFFSYIENNFLGISFFKGFQDTFYKCDGHAYLLWITIRWLKTIVETIMLLSRLTVLITDSLWKK